MKNEFNIVEVDLIRQWFNAVQDLNPDYLESNDYVLAVKIHKLLGLRVANSVLEKLPNPTP